MPNTISSSPSSSSNANRTRTAAGSTDVAGGGGGAVDLQTQLEMLQDQFDGKNVTKTGEKLLKELGFNAGGTPDKHFTATTEKAVEKFQKAAGLHVTGALDTRTLAAMRKAAQEKKKGIEGPGQKSGAIAKHERQLKRAGYQTGPADGVYDQKTKKAVAQFKHDQGIKSKTQVARGLLGPNAQKKLKGESAQVKRAEKELQDLGFHPGTADGKYTHNTQKAIDAFREKKHIGGVGKHATAGTLRAIRKAYQAKHKPKLNSVKGCAQFLLHSKNVSFWSGLSTGSDRKNLERLARGEKAFVPATGGHVKPNLRMMQALVDMAKHGPIQINALTGGIHSTGSNHYRGHAVDLQLGVGNTSEIVSIANRHGGARNSETDHIHLDF